MSSSLPDAISAAADALDVLATTTDVDAVNFCSDTFVRTLKVHAGILFPSSQHTL